MNTIKQKYDLNHEPDARNKLMAIHCAVSKRNAEAQAVLQESTGQPGTWDTACNFYALRSQVLCAERYEHYTSDGGTFQQFACDASYKQQGHPKMPSNR